MLTSLLAPQIFTAQVMTIPKVMKERILHGYETAASNAANYLSVCYGSGFGVEFDKEKMVSWAIVAAGLGSLDPVKSIASHYKDNVEDLRAFATVLFPWLLKAAESGHHDSMSVIMDCYSLGIATDRNV